ncbi:DUF2924 domain-containing protein [Candidatus Avelusimicrobium sp.]|uniref:DUF2924 domain-containing protein n=1 Tax=Candidatus Avelusimicrobium sp. TaxID=3048833 RepID=UPI003F7DA366
MKKNTKKSVTKTKPTQPAVLRVVSPITTEETLLKNLPVRQRDNRLPAPGSIITKNYRGNTIEVKVLEIGFEYQGKTYKSISRVAMEIVKRPISGYVFFGLSK